MAFKGTEKRNAAEIAEAIENVGGHINAYTAREQTAYYVKLLKEDLALGADIIGDILTHSVFAPDEVERERGVILQEIGQANDTPDDIIFDHFQETAYPSAADGQPGARHGRDHPQSCDARISPDTCTAITPPRTWWSPRPATWNMTTSSTW